MSFRTDVRNLSPEGYLRISPVGRNDREGSQNNGGNSVIPNSPHYCHSEQAPLCHSEPSGASVRNLSPEGYLRISPVGRNDRKKSRNDKDVILDGCRIE